MGSNDEYSDDDYDDYDQPYEDIDDYHAIGSDDEDPELIEFSCLSESEVESVINDLVASLCAKLHISPTLAKLILGQNQWDVEKIVNDYNKNPVEYLVQMGAKAEHAPDQPSTSSAGPAIKSRADLCSICFANPIWTVTLDCQHSFCQDCWHQYLKTQIISGSSTRIECMESNCHLYCQEDFVLKVLSSDREMRGLYERNVFREHVVTNPHLRFCPGKECEIISFTKSLKPHRVICKKCNTSYCAKCGQDYHAPATCDVLRKWKVKCADDSETANYIRTVLIVTRLSRRMVAAITCSVQDWKSHGSEYYECSRYRENPSIAQEANNVKARRALEKYLFYFERFENHQKSLKMEEELRHRIYAKIDDKVRRHEGTWIDWQYLHDAASLLTKCRYTLQFTYPFAYYMEGDCRKELFEYQQAQLEKEIEELSWKVERAETTDRCELVGQMRIAERKRRTLLQDFFN